MIISSVLNYFKENNIYDTVTMISNDDDVIGAIKNHSSFNIYKDIQNVCEDLIGFSEKDYRNCEKYIKENEILSKEESYSFNSYNINDDYEIDEIEYSINKLDIIDKNEEFQYIQLCINCDLILKGSFNFVDDEFSVYDHEDPDCSVYWYRRGTTLNVEDINIFISIYYDDKGNFEKYDVEDIDDIDLNNYSYQLEIEE